MYLFIFFSVHAHLGTRERIVKEILMSVYKPHVIMVLVLMESIRINVFVKMVLMVITVKITSTIAKILLVKMVLNVMMVLTNTSVSV